MNGMVKRISKIFLVNGFEIQESFLVDFMANHIPVTNLISSGRREDWTLHTGLCLHSDQEALQ